MRLLLIVAAFLSGFFSLMPLSAQAKLISESMNFPALKVVLESPSISKNAIGNKKTAEIQILLPPDYNTSGSKRYPVVYYLPGFRSDPSVVQSWKETLATAFKDGRSFIIVGVEGKNRYGGGYFVNSDVSGFYEDWLINEVVPFIDGRLRTIPHAGSRGLLGLSMGGFGVLHNILVHPEIFSWGYSVAPGVFEPETGLDEALASWEQDIQFKQAYGSAFAGAPTAVPKLDGSPRDIEIYNLWRTRGFGGWDERLNVYLKKGVRFQGLTIEWGSRDGYTWIPLGSAWLSDYLKSAGLPVITEETTLGHDMPNERLREAIFPFFLQNLKH